MNYGINSNKIQEQIDNLFSLILKEQQQIDSIKQADSDKKDLTKKMLDDFSKLRGNNFFFNYLSSGRGHGPFTMLVDGSVKYDLINAIKYKIDF